MAYKPFDLGFYKGITDNNIFSRQSHVLCVTYGKYVYPFPQEEAQNQMEITIDNNFSFSRKIQNNNFIPDTDNPTSWEALYLVTKAVSSGTTISVTTNVGAKTFAPEENYETYTFYFDYIGVDPVGTIKGLTAKRVIFDNSNDRYIVGFVGAIATYPYAGSIVTPPSEGISVPVNFTLIDVAFDESGQLAYALDDKDNIYSVDLTTGDILPLNIGSADLSNLSSVACDDSYVLFAGVRGDDSYYATYEISTGSVNSTISPFSDTTILINRFGYERSNLEYIVRYYLCSGGEGGWLSDIDISDPSSPVFTFVKANSFGTDIVNNISRLKNTTALYDTCLISTSNGLYFGSANSNTNYDVLLYDSGLNYNDASLSVAVENVVGVGVGVAASDNYFINISFGSVPGLINLIKVQQFDLKSSGLSVSTFRNAGEDGVESTFWLGTTQGLGIQSANSFNTEQPPPDTTISVISSNYDIELRDIIKADVNLYYYLINEVGSSDVDANSILLSYDYKTDTVSQGAPGYFLPTDKLWLVGNSFVLRNLETTSSFYYKNTDNLDLDETSNSDTAAGEDEGLINTTYAGNIVDLIYDRDMFYLIGSRGIEVWQNQGASGFPYRKQEYQSIPYHLSPLSDEDVYDFDVKYWDYYKEGYLLVCLSNKDNQFDIVHIQDGSFSVFPLNKSSFYKILSDETTPVTPVDYSIDIVNFWGKLYILIGLMIEPSGAGGQSKLIIIDENGNITTQPGSGAVDKLEFFQATSTNGIVLNFNSSAELLEMRNFPQLPSSLTTLTAPNITMYSQLFQPTTGTANINRVMIQYELPIDNISNYPINTLSLLFSDDQGRTFTEFYSQVVNTDKRQIIAHLNKTMNSCYIQLRFESALIIMNCVLYYEEAGVA